MWLHSSVVGASHRYSQRSQVQIPLKPWNYQASSFQLLKLENLCVLQSSFFTSSTTAVQMWIISYILHNHRNYHLDYNIHQLQLLLLPFDRMQVFFKIPLGILSDHYRRQLTQVPSSTYLCREAYLRTYYNDPGPAVSRLEVYSINNLQSLGLKQHSTLTFLLFLVAYIKLWSCSCFLLPLVCTLVHWPWLMEQLRLLRYCVCLTLFNVFSSN